jgi:hypothetical protein
MATYHKIRRKTEDAIQTFLEAYDGAGLTGYTYYKGANLGALSRQRVEITAGEAEPERIADTYTGNWRVTATLAVVSHKDDKTRAQHSAACAEWEDAMMRDDVVATINTAQSANEYKVFQWWPGRASDLMSQSELRSEYTVEVYCRPSVPT